MASRETEGHGQVVSLVPKGEHDRRKSLRNLKKKKVKKLCVSSLQVNITLVEIKQAGRETGHSSSCGAEVKNEWSYILPLRPHMPSR
jgi:hypothetical protein